MISSCSERACFESACLIAMLRYIHSKCIDFLRSGLDAAQLHMPSIGDQAPVGRPSNPAEYFAPSAPCLQATLLCGMDATHGAPLSKPTSNGVWKSSVSEVFSYCKDLLWDSCASSEDCYKICDNPKLVPPDDRWSW